MTAAAAKRKPKEGEEESEFKLEFDGDERSLGAYQYAILHAVSIGQYQESLKLIGEYKRNKFGFPPFKRRSEKLILLCEEHITSIETKLSIPNITGMLLASQQEIYESVDENWEHLVRLVKKLRAIEKEFASADAKSSLIVVKAVMFSALMILATFMIQETLKMVGGNFDTLVDSIIKFMNKILFGS